MESKVARSHHGEPIFVLCDGDLAASASRLGALVDTVRDGEAEMAVAAFATRVGGGVGLAVGAWLWLSAPEASSSHVSIVPIAGPSRGELTVRGRF